MNISYAYPQANHYQWWWLARLGRKPETCMSFEVLLVCTPTCTLCDHVEAWSRSSPCACGSTADMLAAFRTLAHRCSVHNPDCRVPRHMCIIIIRPLWWVLVFDQHFTNGNTNQNQDYKKASKFRSKFRSGTRERLCLISKTGGNATAVRNTRKQSDQVAGHSATACNHPRHRWCLRG